MIRRVLIILCLCLYPVLAQSATYYTAQSGGSDGNSCGAAQSQSTPKQTINAGIACLGAGDTLLVKPGTYQEVLIWYWHGNRSSGSAGAPITVKSEVPRAAIIQPGGAGAGQGCGGGSTIVGFEGQSYWTYEGFVTDGTGMTAVVHFANCGGPTTHISIINNEMRYGANLGFSNPQAIATIGVSSRPDDDYWVISGNSIHDMGYGASSGVPFFDYGIYFVKSNTIVENNEIYNCSGYGIHFYNSAGGSHDNIFRNNRIHHNGVIGGKGGFLFAAGGNHNKAYNNVIYANGEIGLQMGGYAPSFSNEVYNNTIVGNASQCIGIGSATPSDSNTLRNNICYQNAQDTISGNGSGNEIDHNLLGNNPLFVSLPSADFHLQLASPAIDAGIYVGLPYKGSAPDEGALEMEEAGPGGGASKPRLPAPTNLRASK